MFTLRSHRSTIAAAIGLLFTAVASSAATIHVPRDHPTIQAAINAANHGDQIVVAPGTYNESIEFKGKSIILRSADGPEATTVKAAGKWRSTVSFTAGEGPSTIIDGFTITGGTGTPGHGHLRGGGILILNSSPTIYNCIVSGNTADIGAGAFVGPGSQPWIVESVVKNNVASAYGGGIYNGAVGDANPDAIGVTVVDTAFHNNAATIGGAFRGSGQIAFIGCTFAGNAASDAAGGISIFAGNLVVASSEFMSNTMRALVAGPAANATVIDSTFAEHPNGALTAWTTTYHHELNVIGCTFDRNVGATGAAIGISGPIDVAVADTDFLKNTATGFGGAIGAFCYTGVEAHCPTIVIEHSDFVANVASTSGGAIANGCSGGAFGADCASLDIHETVLSQNEAGIHGGAIHNRCAQWVDPETNKTKLACGEINISASVLDRNLAGAGGGAIANLDESSATIEDTFMCGNHPQHVMGDWDDEGGNEFTSLADLNCDGSVGVSDLLILLANWGTCDDEPGTCLGDLTGDDTVGIPDLLMLLAGWK